MLRKQKPLCGTYFTFYLHVNATVLRKPAIQRDKRLSTFETTLPKVSAGIALIVALIFVLRSSELVGLAQNTTSFK